MIRLKFAPLLYITSLFIFYGCLKSEDQVNVVPSSEFNSTEEIIHYLENRGDFINSAECPAIVEAEEVFNNLHSYLIIDVRSEGEYSGGHIETAVNVPNDSLISYLNNLDLQPYPKIIIVSKNGQASAFYASLLRIYGFSNAYSMNYGMAAWHRDFSEDWFAALGIFEYSSDDPPPLTDLIYRKGGYQKFPVLEFSSQSLSVEERIKERVEKVIQEDFPEKMTSYNDLYPSITRDMVFERKKVQTPDYIICSGTFSAYLYGPRFGTIVHIVGAVHYYPPANSDFASSLYLQTIPTNKKVIIYSYEGNLSAFITAYLRFLGYDAASMLYGLNSIFYSSMFSVPALDDYAFTASKVKNYTYTY